jgi:phage terminase Nu1 subunit (DNA packaging protein)
MDLDRLSQKDVAKLLLVEDRTLRNLKGEGIPQHGEGRGLYYIWSEVAPWWLNRQMAMVASKRSAIASGVPNIFVSDARKAAADAEIAEMKAEVMKGNLLESEAVRVVWEKHIGMAASKLEGVGAKVAPRLADGMTVAERQLAIDTEIFAIMEELQTSREVVDP